ncbi:hypothetical protein DPEC_G00268650 [Dallia pectoralis]|uniref:Uncharacterized protein n=1 Tax=Dallia pectoralis TaxID=75939 RepID=A0ACC2FNY5_DALPE|nr:hypothetical protein DPEC_G00268650 [Dallia pectoralis]
MGVVTRPQSIVLSIPLLTTPPCLSSLVLSYSSTPPCTPACRAGLMFLLPGQGGGTDALCVFLQIIITSLTRWLCSACPRDLPSLPQPRPRRTSLTASESAQYSLSLSLSASAPSLSTSCPLLSHPGEQQGRRGAGGY